MRDYEKVEQAHKLLMESKVPFVCAFQKENDESTTSSIVGTEFNTVMNLRGIVKNLSLYSKAFHTKEEFLKVLFAEFEEVIDEAYSEDEEKSMQ